MLATPICLTGLFFSMFLKGKLIQKFVSPFFELTSIDAPIAFKPLKTILNPNPVPLGFNS